MRQKCEKHVLQRSAAARAMKIEYHYIILRITKSATKCENHVLQRSAAARKTKIEYRYHYKNDEKCDKKKHNLRADYRHSLKDHLFLKKKETN